MHTTYGMDTCIETNEILAFGMEVYSRYMPGICKNLEYVRHIPDICLTYDTIRIPDEQPEQLLQLNFSCLVSGIRAVGQKAHNGNPDRLYEIRLFGTYRSRYVPVCTSMYPGSTYWYVM